ncbi:6817_t:CDS:10 [Diversispora eburnea]|uniref:6817_t:CDS:1 n=1 Tax=Diversispora eburnea TaxID=1213867 RepID=A0A9N8VJW3_9GLOM|nr:6817_t:CDS:10 [Diversispora eburnea]
MSKEEQPSNPPGEKMSTMSAMLDYSANAIQNFDPIKNVHEHICGFHFYSHDSTRQVEAHHYCAHLNEEFRQCLIYDSNKPDAKLIGVEYIISAKTFLWDRLKEVLAFSPIRTESAEKKIMEGLVDTYGKTWHFWQIDRGDKLPYGPPQLMMSFLEDNQVSQDLINDRDKRFNVSTSDKRDKRAYIKPVYNVNPDADHWAHRKDGKAYILQVFAFPYNFINEDTPVEGQRTHGGLFAGLTLGLMSLDGTNLHILSRSGDETQRKYAARIQPIRRNGHLLLVTLLLGNVLVNEALPIIMDDAMGGGGVTAILVSSALIVIFGEVIPQAVCSRYGLVIGAFFAWPVRILIWATYIVSYPMAKLLDLILGENHGIIYRRADSTERGGDLVKDSVTIIRGALDLQDKVVESAMTPINKAFMIPIDSIMDRITLREIYSTGHSRIPVYGESRENILGSLIMYSPDENKPLNKFRINTMPTVDAKTPLFDILNTFQDGRSHMAIVVEEEQAKPIGIITLEDVLEELIQEEIYDESDARVGLAVKLETGDQLIIASKRKRTGSATNNQKNKFKSQAFRSNTDPILTSKAPVNNSNDGNSKDLIVFDEPNESSLLLPNASLPK